MSVHWEQLHFFEVDQEMWQKKEEDENVLNRTAANNDDEDSNIVKYARINRNQDRKPKSMPTSPNDKEVTDVIEDIKAILGNAGIMDSQLRISKLEYRNVLRMMNETL